MADVLSREQVYAIVGAVMGNLFWLLGELGKRESARIETNLRED